HEYRKRIDDLSDQSDVGDALFGRLRFAVIEQFEAGLVHASCDVIAAASTDAIANCHLCVLQRDVEFLTAEFLDYQGVAGAENIDGLWNFDPADAVNRVLPGAKRFGKVLGL